MKDAQSFQVLEWQEPALLPKPKTKTLPMVRKDRSKLYNEVSGHKKGPRPTQPIRQDTDDGHDYEEILEKFPKTL